jgi:hypothetical protein
MEQTTPQESIRQFLLAVAGNHNNRPMFGLDMLAGLYNIEANLIQLK